MLAIIQKPSHEIHHHLPSFYFRSLSNSPDSNFSLPQLFKSDAYFSFDCQKEEEIKFYLNLNVHTIITRNDLKLLFSFRI
jgi:hypothetical protein